MNTQTKLAMMLSGARVIMSDAELESLTDNKWSNHIRSIPNPAQVGLLDRYECWIARQDVLRMAQADGQITAGGMGNPLPSREGPFAGCFDNPQDVDPNFRL